MPPRNLNICKGFNEMVYYWKLRFRGHGEFVSARGRLENGWNSRLAAVRPLSSPTLSRLHFLCSSFIRG